MPLLNYADDDDEGINGWRKDFEAEVEKARKSKLEAMSAFLTANQKYLEAAESANAARCRIEEAEAKLAELRKPHKDEEPRVIGIKLGESKPYTKDEIDKLLESITAKANVKVTAITMPRAQQVAKPHGLRDRLRPTFRALFN